MMMGTNRLRSQPKLNFDTANSSSGETYQSSYLKHVSGMK